MDKLSKNLKIFIILVILANFARNLNGEENIYLEKLWIEFKEANRKIYMSLEEEYNR